MRRIDTSLILLVVALVLAGWVTLMGLSFTDRLQGDSGPAATYQHE